MFWSYLLVAFALGGSCVSGQMVGAVMGGSPVVVYTYPDLPFSATDESTRTNTLQSGRVTSWRNETTMARNAAGQVYREVRMPILDGYRSSGELINFTVADPIERTLTSCTVSSKACQVETLRPAAPRRNPAARSMTTEDLGAQGIDGMSATGKRLTFERPGAPGTEGQPLRSTEERWTSADLKQDVLVVINGSTGSHQEDRLHVTSRTAPEQRLFAIPEGYRVEDERGKPAPAPYVPAPGTERIGNGVSAPIVVSAPEPEFSKEARGKKISGNVMVHLVVDENGLPQNVTVVRGIGYGLDEKAVEAVGQYRFKPAMKEGKPVKVEMNVAVNFQLF